MRALPAPARARYFSYLGSGKHFGGCALALLAVGLAVLDPVGPQAVVLIAGFYLAGAVATPAGRANRAGALERQLRRSLRQDLARVSGLVPPEVSFSLQRIQLALESEILPGLDCLAAESADLHLVRATVRDYLPAALDAYLHLPSGYVSQQPGSEGRPAVEILQEELHLLERGMASVASAVHRSRMDQLLAHGRFLSERFGSSGRANLLS